VYGDTPNKLSFIEKETRYEIDDQSFHEGISENMSIDATKHSIFGASKVAADVLCQEYGRYFGLNVGIFRCGCITGPNHRGVELHGFLSYLVKVILSGKLYTIYGYNGKQVRDNIHASDLVEAFDCFYRLPRKGEVYNMGGSRHSNISIIEAVSMIEKISGKKANTKSIATPREGDHKWYISDVRKFKSHYPEWDYKYDMAQIITELIGSYRE
jgi:CDP-paratose 2-epimerase